MSTVLSDIHIENSSELHGVNVSSHTDEIMLWNKVNKIPIKSGEIYYHYKNPDKCYKIIAVGLGEEYEEPEIIYQALYGKQLIWTRKWSIWNTYVSHNGETVPRFTKSNYKMDTPTTIVYDDILYVSLQNSLSH